MFEPLFYVISLNLFLRKVIAIGTVFESQSLIRLQLLSLNDVVPKLFHVIYTLKCSISHNSDVRSACAMTKTTTSALLSAALRCKFANGVKILFTFWFYKHF